MPSFYTVAHRLEVSTMANPISCPHDHKECLPFLKDAPRSQQLDVPLLTRKNSNCSKPITSLVENKGFIQSVIDMYRPNHFTMLLYINQISKSSFYPLPLKVLGFSVSHMDTCSHFFTFTYQFLTSLSNFNFVSIFLPFYTPQR